MIKMRLGDLLVESQLITQSQLESALEVQKKSGGKKLGNILVDLGIVSEEQMLEVLRKKLNTNIVNLAGVQVSERCLALVPEAIAREKQVFPYQLQGNTLYLATSDPLDYETINQVGAMSGRGVEPVIAMRSDISAAIHRYYNKSNIDNMASVLDNTASIKDAAEQLSAIDFEEIESRVGSVPVVKFINNLILQAHAKRASDIHIEPVQDFVKVRFRIDGELIEIVRLSINAHPGIITRVKIMAGMDIAEKRIPLDGRFDTIIDGVEVSVRAASMPTVFGEKMVLRLLADTKSGIESLETLGVSPQHCAEIRTAMQSPNGLILVTGPTGSGKSTTLYSLLNELYEENTNILTIEDPVEKIVPGVNQTQVNPKAGLTFASGLRAILRQDPDKIMIGEIRDTETADIAARAAITGHLVLASMHTNSAAASYMRLVDMGIEPYIVASSVVAVVAQRLVRLICPRCKEEYATTPEEAAMLKRIGEKAPATLHRGKGCEFCEYTGHLGRTAVLEVVSTDAKLRDLVVSKANAVDIETYLNSKSQRYMLDNALDLVRTGQIRLKELLVFTQLFEER